MPRKPTLATTQELGFVGRLRYAVGQRIRQTCADIAEQRRDGSPFSWQLHRAMQRPWPFERLPPDEQLRVIPRFGKCGGIVRRQRLPTGECITVWKAYGSMIDLLRHKVQRMLDL